MEPILKELSYNLGNCYGAMELMQKDLLYTLEDLEALWSQTWKNCSIP